MVFRDTLKTIKVKNRKENEKIVPLKHEIAFVYNRNSAKMKAIGRDYRCIDRHYQRVQKTLDLWTLI